MIKVHKKIAENQEQEVDAQRTPGLVMGPAFDFLFEGNNNQYNDKYEHYI